MVDAVLEDFRSAPISEKDRALFAFIEKVNRASNRIGPHDIQTAVAAGWTEEALYDAITVCALFKFYTTWVDGSGVANLTDDGYAMSGQRLAARGYVPGD